METIKTQSIIINSYNTPGPLKSLNLVCSLTGALPLFALYNKNADLIHSFAALTEELKVSPQSCDGVVDRPTLAEDDEQ